MLKIHFLMIEKHDNASKTQHLCMLNYEFKLNNAPLCKEATTSHFILYFDTTVCCNVMRTQRSTYLYGVTTSY